MSANRKQNRRLGRGSGWISAVLGVLLCSGALYGQTDARPQRSPWRASFNQLNRDAVDTQLQNEQRPEVPAPGQWKPASQGADSIDVSRRLRNDSPSENLPSEHSPNRPSSSLGVRQANHQGQGPEQTSAIGSKITRTMDRLPNDAGQVWREYDISPYTSNIQSVDNPQQTVLDWVLRETGTEMWFNQPLGILHATPSRLIVYHTQEIQAEVKNIVDRLVRTRGQLQSYNVNLVTVGNPNWRAQAYALMQTINVESPGVEAWLVSKENAALLFNQLKHRADFKEHSGGTINTHDGQSFTLERTRPVPFVRSLRWTPGQFPGYEPLMTTINEGYTVSLSPLLALDNQSVEIAIKCDVDQVERLTPVKVPVGGPNNTVQNVGINVPKMVSWRLHERFRWPSDQVLVISSGVVADPEPEPGSGIGSLRSMAFGATRQNKSSSDALLMIEYRGPSAGASLPRSAGRSRLKSLDQR